MTKVTRRRIQLGHSVERRDTVNGQPGLLVVEPDGRVSDVITIDIAGGAIRGVLIVRTPTSSATSTITHFRRAGPCCDGARAHTRERPAVQATAHRAVEHA